MSVQTKPKPLTADELADWLRQTVAEAYHGADGTNQHHDFAECGDPFCTDAQARLAQVLDAVSRSFTGIGRP
jgi:hypothetical protein